MSLDPDNKGVLDLIEAAARPSIYAFPPQQAREFYKLSRAPFQPELPEVSEGFAPGQLRVPPARSHCDVIAVKVQWMASFLSSSSITEEAMLLAIWIRTITYVER